MHKLTPGASAGGEDADAAALQALATELLRAAFFAVDLELHSMRSYHGFTCLLQVSVPAREDMGSSEVTDYVVDVLALWEHMALLKPAFEEPGVLKVPPPPPPPPPPCPACVPALTLTLLVALYATSAMERTACCAPVTR
ncbi:MAG: hypothetical protein ACK4YT_14055 [Sphingomonas sp.]